MISDFKETYLTLCYFLDPQLVKEDPGKGCSG